MRKGGCMEKPCRLNSSYGFTWSGKKSVNGIGIDIGCIDMRYLFAQRYRH